MEYLQPYHWTILVLGLISSLLFIQLLVADLTILFSPHSPGYPVKADYTSWIFRASRVHANTNESIAIFILFAAFGMLTQADPYWLNLSSLMYFAGRVGHMVTYYLDWRPARVGTFVVSLLGLGGMFFVGLFAWFS